MNSEVKYFFIIVLQTAQINQKYYGDEDPTTY